MRYYLDVEHGLNERAEMLKLNLLREVQRVNEKGNRMPSGAQFHLTVEFVTLRGDADHIIEVVGGTGGATSGVERGAHGRGRGLDRHRDPSPGYRGRFRTGEVAGQPQCDRRVRRDQFQPQPVRMVAA